MKFFILFLLFGSYLLGYVGSVHKLRGDVHITRDGSKFKVTQNTKLLEKDLIQTSNSAKVQMVFRDETIITLGKNSIFTVEKYNFTKNENKANFSFSQGSMKFLTGAIGKIAPNRFKIQTKTATIGIRGTYVASFYKDDTLGVLYLGEGKGTTVTNNKGQTVLDEIGDGVFLTQNQTPPQKEKWSAEQTYELLNELNFQKNDKLPQSNLSYLDNWKYKGNLQWFYAPNENNSFYANDIAASFSLKSPTLYDFFIEGTYDTKYSIGNNSKNNDTNIYVLSNANINYLNKKVHLRVGRQELSTPLTALSTISPSFKTNSFTPWNEKEKIYDWWWALPTNFEALSTFIYPTTGLKITLSHVTAMKQAQNNEFISLGKSLFSTELTNHNNKTDLSFIGLQYLAYNNIKLQAWYYHLKDLMKITYFQADASFELKNTKVLTALQYSTEKNAGSLNQKINAELQGARLALTNGGVYLTTSFTQTKDGDKTSNYLTPFDGMPAFTNTFALRSNTSSIAQKMYNNTGPYTSGTLSKQISGGLDFNYLGLNGIKWFANYTSYNKKNQTSDINVYCTDFSYIPPKYENFLVNFKYSKIKNAQYTQGKVVNFSRLMVGMKF